MAEHQAVLSGAEDDVRLFGQHGDLVAWAPVRAELSVVSHSFLLRDLGDSYLKRVKITNFNQCLILQTLQISHFFSKRRKVKNWSMLPIIELKNVPQSNL